MAKNKTEVQQLPCGLTDKDVLKMADAMTQDYVKAKEVEIEFEKVKKSYKAKLELLCAAFDKASNEIARREQVRDVEVELVPHFLSNEIEYIRTDTGETVSKRSMFPEERAEQEQIPGVDTGEPENTVEMPAQQ